MSSATGFNLDQPKSLLSGNGLTLYQIAKFWASPTLEADDKQRLESLID